MVDPASPPPPSLASGLTLQLAQRIIEHAPIGLAMVNTAGSIVMINGQIERTFGYRRQELLGQSIDILVPQQFRSQHPSQVQQFFNSPSVRAMGSGRDLFGIRKDGAEIPLEIGLSPIETAEGLHVMTSIVDISARKRSEMEIRRLHEELARHAHEIELSNRELTDFAYIVSHDLKAPLRGIASLANWLAADYADTLDTAGREHLALLDNRVKRLNALIDGILAYSRAGRSREQRLPMDLDQVARTVTDLLAPPSHIHITIETPLPTLDLEPIKIQQVFQNLLSNAIKFMDKPEGRIGIRCHAENRQWHFVVSDNGPGIEGKYFDRIFQLFQTLAPRDEIEGTGVGLALVKKVIEQEGGRVWVESVPGAGAAFHFTLPQQNLLKPTPTTTDKGTPL